MFKRKTKKEKTILLLRELASEGDLQAQQMLNLYNALEETRNMSPIYESISVLKDTKALDTIGKCLKKANFPKDDK